MKTKFVLPKHSSTRGFSCGNTTRIIWRKVGGKKVARCAVCERQLKPQTFEEVLASFTVSYSRGCGNGTICGKCWKCS